MATLTVQPPGKDSWLLSASTNNYGTSTELNLRDDASQTRRIVLEFDTTAIPVNAIITSATLSLYYYDYSFNDPNGKTVNVYALNRANWVENEITWYIYKTGSNWTDNGGDYQSTTPTPGTATIPASPGWMDADVKNVIQSFVTAGTVTELLLITNPETNDTSSLIYFRSKGYGTSTYRPKLVVNYVLPPDAPTDVVASTNDALAVNISWTASPTGVDYKVKRDGVDISGWLGDVATYEDTGADAPVITPSATVTVSRNRYYQSVKMKTNPASIANGTTHEYTVVAKDASGYESADSAAAEGYRKAMELEYQWQRSAADSDASYTDLEAGAVRTHWDYTAPDYPAARYYRCKITSTGADDAYTTAARGYRRNPELAAAPYRVFMVIKDIYGNTLANIEPGNPSIVNSINELPRLAFDIPDDSFAVDEIDEDAEIWLYVNGELQNIYYLSTEDDA